MGSSPLHDHNLEGGLGVVQRTDSAPLRRIRSAGLFLASPGCAARFQKARVGQRRDSIPWRGRAVGTGAGAAPVRRSHALPPLHRFRAVTTSTAIPIGFILILTPATARDHCQGIAMACPCSGGGGFVGCATCGKRETPLVPTTVHYPGEPGEIHPTGGGDEHPNWGSPQVR